MKWLWLVFVVGAAMSWGLYVPILHQGQAKLGPNSALRAFLFVGVAYFLAAVILPCILLKAGAEPREFTKAGVGFSLGAGIAGAAGALCVAYAIKSGGKPLYIAPLIFAGAPIVNTLVSMAWHPPASAPRPIFFVGMIMAALGAGIVLYSKPAPPRAPVHSGGVVVVQDGQRDL